MTFLPCGTAFVADGDDGGFVEDDAFVAGEDEGVGCAKVNGQVGGEVPTESSEHSKVLSGTACASACHRQVFQGVFIGFFHAIDSHSGSFAAKPG